MAIAKRIAKIKIGTRLAILTVVAIMAAISVFAAITLREQRRHSMEFLKSHSDNLGQLFENNLRLHMLQSHDKDLFKVVCRLAHSWDKVTAIAVLDHRGTVVSAIPDELIGREFGIEDFRCSVCHEQETPLVTPADDKLWTWHPEEEQARMVIPIYAEPLCRDCHYHRRAGKVLGIAEIAISTLQIQEQMRVSYLHLFLYSLAIIAAVSLVVLFATRRWIGRPVRELIEGTRKVAAGDLDHCISPGFAELGELAEAFNTMQEKLKSSRQQLIVTEKLASIGKLAAGVAHEINNPLTGILTFTEGLLEESAIGDKRREDYRVIRHETLRCRTIVRNLLDFARQSKSEFVSADLNDVIAKTLEMLGNQSLFANVRFRFDASHPVPSMFLDPGQMQQVFVNLLVNAAEAMPDGGEIAIATEFISHEGRVKITVGDSGTGICEADLSHIFEPFFSTKGEKGNGLGLSVVWGIVEQHSGKCEVASAPGKGTTFFIYLPIGQGDLPREKHAAGEEEGTAGVKNCWEIMNCTMYAGCPAYPDRGKLCWEQKNTLCASDRRQDFLDHLEVCKDCKYYRYRHGKP